MRMVRTRRSAPGRRGWQAAGAGIAVLVAVVSLVSSAQPPGASPNVLLVTLDTLRADRLGAYGYAKAATPVLDGLARRGVLFADATTQSPLTGPAHAALLTGTYPARFAVRDNATTPLPTEATTLAELLAPAGYATAAFIGAFILDRPYGFAQGFDVFKSGFTRVDSGTEAEAQRRANAVVDDALEWLGKTPASRPFFAWVHLYDAHTPYDPPPPLSRTFAGRPYDGEVALVDQQIGRLLNRLATDRRLDRTLVVAVADHGEALGDHGEEDHGLFLYDEVLRIPWIMAGPRVPAGRVVSEQVRAIDLLPTVTALLGLEVKHRLDGESVVGLIGGSQRRDPPPSYAETYYGKLHFGWSELRSLRADGWKAIDAPKPELYNLKSDPGERQNVYEPRQALAGRMIEQAVRLERELGGAPAAAVAPPDPETLERLRSLGYVGIAATPRSGAGRGADPKDVVGQLREYRTLLSQALTDLRTGRPAAAEARLKRLIAINERAADLHIYLGDAYLQQRVYDKAVGEYEAAAVLNPGSAAPLVAAAHAYLAQGAFDAARKKVDQAVQLEPASFEVAIVDGRLHERTGRDADALASYQRAVGLNPSNPRPRALLSAVALRRGQLDLADAQLRALADMKYEPARTAYGLGLVAERRGSLSDAAALYRKALALDPRLDMAREALARVAPK